MYRILLNCYYDGLTIEQAKEFIRDCYKEEVTEKQIEKAKLIIMNCEKKEWK